MKKSPSLSMSMQLLESFKEYARPFSRQFNRQLAHYVQRFLSVKSQSGFAPYQMEYGIDASAAVASFYDELDGDQACDTANPPVYPPYCLTSDECSNANDCQWPTCNYENPVPYADPVEERIVDEPWAPVPTPLPLPPDALQFSPAIPQKPAETLAGKGIDPLPVPPSPPEETGSFPAIPEKKTPGNEPGSHPPVDTQHLTAKTNGDISTQPPAPPANTGLLRQINRKKH